MRVYTKNSFSITIKEKYKQDINDIATALYNEIKASNIDLSIDTLGLLLEFIHKCKSLEVKK